MTERDIRERLRGEAELIEAGGASFQVHLPPLLRDAADEVDHMLAETARLQAIEKAAKAVNDSTYSHVDGRDLLAEIHPRHELDIKRRIDGRETWFEGDWLSNLWAAVKPLRALLPPQPARCSQCGGVLPKHTAFCPDNPNPPPTPAPMGSIMPAKLRGSY
jgi:hypothetical protein